MSLRDLPEGDKRMLDELSENFGSFSHFQLYRLVSRFLRKAKLSKENFIVHPPLYSRQIKEKFLSFSYYTGYEERIEVEVNFLSLYGAFGAVPDKLNEDLIKYDNEANNAPRDFLDMFQSELHDLYFRSCVGRSTAINYIEFGDRSYKDALDKIKGARDISESGGIDVSIFHRLCTSKHRNLKGLKKIINHFCQKSDIRYPIVLNSFTGDRAEISSKSLSKMGKVTLGKNIVVGNLVRGNSSVIGYDIHFGGFGEYFQLIYLGKLEELVRISTWYMRFDYKYLFSFDIPKLPDAVLLSNPRTHLGVSSWLLDRESFLQRGDTDRQREFLLASGTYFEYEALDRKYAKIYGELLEIPSTGRSAHSQDRVRKVEQQVDFSLEKCQFSATSLISSIDRVKETEGINASLTLESIDKNDYYTSWLDEFDFGFVPNFSKNKEFKKKKKSISLAFSGSDATVLTTAISDEMIAQMSGSANQNADQVGVISDEIPADAEVSTETSSTPVVAEERGSQEVAQEASPPVEVAPETDSGEKGEEIDYFSQTQEED